LKEGVYWNNVRYTTSSANENIIVAKKGNKGLAFAKTHQTIIVAEFDATQMQPAAAAATLQKLRDELTMKGY